MDRILILLLTLSLLLGGGMAAARELRVAPGEPLQARLDQLADGDTLVLQPGIHHGPLRIAAAITLRGAPGAVLDGQGEGDAVRVTAPGVVIEGLTIRNWGRDIGEMNAAVFVEPQARGVTIRDNVLRGAAFGIWLDSAPEGKVLDNRIQGDTSVRSQDRGNGIHLYNVQNTLVQGNEVWHTRDGIYIDTSNQNTLRDNYLHDLRYGVHYMYSFHNTMAGNLTRRTRTGYAFMQSKYLTVTGNRSEQDQNYGMLMNFITRSEFRDNRISGVRQGENAAGGAIDGAEGKALFIYNSQFNSFHGNLFADSDIGVHMTAGSEDNVLTGNAFVGNREQIKYVATREQEWSEEGRGNYWSDYLGWDMNGDGLGDVPHEPNDAVDRILWKHPAAKLLMHAPAVETLRWVQRDFPVLRPEGVRDSHPLMQPPMKVAEGEA